MDSQYNNLLLGSLMLYYENKILDKGNAYTNVTSQFYATTGDFDGLYSYAAPFKPFVSDASIPSNRMSGVYIGNTFHSLGSGEAILTGINFQEGLVYLTSEATGTVSGSYAVQDFFITSTAEAEDDLLFERKYHIRPKTSTQSGVNALLPSEMTVPTIFFKLDKSKNEEYALGGVEETKNTISCVILADSQFLLDAVTSIIRDTTRSYIPEIASNEFPFNALGSFQDGATYNFDTLTANKITNASGYYIENIEVLGFTRNLDMLNDIKRINPKVYVNMVVIEVASPARTPRQC